MSPEITAPGSKVPGGSIQAELNRLTARVGELTRERDRALVLVSDRDARIRQLSAAVRDLAAPALRAAKILEGGT